MKKTRELIAQNLKAVDVVAELLDARIPAASRNPIIGEIVGDKPRIVILNKSDLADPEANKAWKKALTDDGGEGTKAVVLMNAMTGQGSKDLVRELEKLKEEKAATDRLNRPLRLMVLGVPNVGKSSFINRMTGRKRECSGLMSATRCLTSRRWRTSLSWNISPERGGNMSRFTSTV